MIAGLKHYTQWRRIAVVSGQQAVQWFSDVFRIMVPGKSKGFAPDELPQAIAWVSETDDQ